MATEVVIVRCWGQDVGAVVPAPRERAYAFAYEPSWISRGIELAPLRMPVSFRTRRSPRTWVFPELSERTFMRLPALLSDALPDAFGNALINARMAARGIDARSITPLDRLAYMGARGMGALEFEPADQDAAREPTVALEMRGLVEAARAAVAGKLDEAQSAESLQRLIEVGTSAGGMRAKAVIALNPATGEIRSGQFAAPEGFEHWLLKFDGIGTDSQLGATGHYGRIEYAYHLMAVDAGIAMTECRLLEEGGRAHFMTRRFDREAGRKHHIQSLCAMDHLDYNMAGTHAYEQLFMVARRLELGPDAMAELFRRMAFNVVARNCDDHTKNFAFLLREGAAWELAPAYDVTHAYSSTSEWTRQHQMSVGGKFDGIGRPELLTLGLQYEVTEARKLLDRVVEVVRDWGAYAAKAGVPADETARIKALHEFV